MSKINVFIHSIEWNNPYTEPPDGAPRVLAEAFSQNARPPSGFPRLKKIGGGYSHCVRCLRRPPERRLDQRQLSNLRRKRLRRRMERRYPMFAEQLIAEKIAANPDYYNGMTDPVVEARRNAALDEYATLYARAVENLGRVFVYAEEPMSCRV